MVQVREVMGPWAAPGLGSFSSDFVMFSLLFLLLSIILALCTNCRRHSFTLRDGGEEVDRTQSQLVRVVKLEDALAARENPMINDIRKDESDFSPRPEESVIGVPEQPPADQDVTWLKPWRSHREAPDQGDSPSALQIANRTPLAMTVISPSPPTTVDIGDLSDVLNFTPELHFIPAPVAMVEVDTPLESLSPPVYSEDTLAATIVSSFEPVDVPIMSSFNPVAVPILEPVEAPIVDLPIMDVTIVNSLEPLQAPIVDAPIVSSLEPVEHADATVINDLDILNAPVGLENLDAPVINSLDTLVLDALIVNSLEPVDIPVINDLGTPDPPIVNILYTLELDAPIIDVPIVDSLAPVEFPTMNDIDLLEAPAEFSSSFNPQLEVEVHVEGEGQNQGLSLYVRPQHTYEIIGEPNPNEHSVEVDLATASSQTIAELVNKSTTHSDNDTTTVTEPADLASPGYETIAELVQDSSATTLPDDDPITTTVTEPGDLITPEYETIAELVHKLSATTLPDDEPITTTVTEPEGLDLTSPLSLVEEGFCDRGWNPMYARVRRKLSKSTTPPPVLPSEDEELEGFSPPLPERSGEMEG
ncbi:uncharacterized protein LOC112256787 isoform X1 [Oncorhynchus tshawytscha]|uniref:uncharacterized protein LOC112256787 isoform X1 n=2 Tax=Oncorhynchus tshawytscha TaxID=74940 RepID=UPI000D0A191E|nr:uncharacterized protein LOC112256787 isoform X1 [Oncorhynchus tshawytscha]XP_024286052.1 uncharacterized protein LOC112256787 isoform X1 [Oncorhynchus tshawytscha]